MTSPMSPSSSSPSPSASPTLQQCLLELVCHTRWIIFRVLNSSPQEYIDKYHLLLQEAHSTLNEISFPMIQVNDLCDIPPRTLDLLCDGSVYLLAAEQVLLLSSSSSSSSQQQQQQSQSQMMMIPPSLHPFLEANARNGTRSPATAQLMAIRWFSAVGLLNPYELIDVIFGAPEHIPEFASEEEMFMVSAEKLSNSQFFFVGAHITILRGILHRYCMELVIPEKVIAHYKLACDRFGEMDNFSPRAASRLLLSNDAKSKSNMNGSRQQQELEETAAAHELTAFVQQTPLDEILFQWILTVSKGMTKQQQQQTNHIRQSPSVERNLMDEAMNGHQRRATASTPKDHKNNNHDALLDDERSGDDTNLYKIISDGVALSRVIQHYRPDILPDGPLHVRNAQNNISPDKPHHHQPHHQQPNSSPPSSSSSSAVIRSPPRSDKSTKLSTWNRQENWSQLIQAMEQIGIWVGIYAEELISYCTSNLQLHVLRLVEEVFCVVVRPSRSHRRDDDDATQNNNNKNNCGSNNENDEDEDEECCEEADEEDCLDEDDDETQQADDDNIITKNDTLLQQQQLQLQHAISETARSTTSSATTTTTSLAALRAAVAASSSKSSQENKRPSAFSPVVNTNNQDTNFTTSKTSSSTAKQPYFVTQHQQSVSVSSSVAVSSSSSSAVSPKLISQNKQQLQQQAALAAPSLASPKRAFSVLASVNQSMVAELPSSTNFVAKSINDVSSSSSTLIPEQNNSNDSSSPVFSSQKGKIMTASNRHHHHQDVASTEIPNENDNKQQYNFFSPSLQTRLFSKGNQYRNANRVNPLAKSISMPIREAFSIFGTTSSSSGRSSGNSGRSDGAKKENNNMNMRTSNIVSMSLNGLPLPSSSHATVRSDPVHNHLQQQHKPLAPELESILSQMTDMMMMTAQNENNNNHKNPVKMEELVTQLRSSIRKVEFDSVMKHMTEYASVMKQKKNNINNKEKQETNITTNTKIPNSLNKSHHQEHSHRPRSSSALPRPVAFEIPLAATNVSSKVAVQKLKEKFDAQLPVTTSMNANNNNNINQLKKPQQQQQQQQQQRTRSTSANSIRTRQATPTTISQPNEVPIKNTTPSGRRPSPSSSTSLQNNNNNNSNTSIVKTKVSALRQISININPASQQQGQQVTETATTSSSSSSKPNIIINKNIVDDNNNNNIVHPQQQQQLSAQALLAQHQAHIAEIRAHLKEHPNLTVAKRNNRNVITNALRHVCLPGPVNKPLLDIATRLMEEEPQDLTQQFVVLLKEEGSAFRGLYAVRNSNQQNHHHNQDGEQQQQQQQQLQPVLAAATSTMSNNNNGDSSSGAEDAASSSVPIILHRVFGAGPSLIRADAIGDPLRSGSDRPYRAYKFDTGSKRFSNISTNHFSNVVDAVTLWPKLRN